MAQKTNNQRRELSDLAESNGKWHSVLLDDDSLVENIILTNSGPKVLEVKPHKKPSVEEVKASFIKNGGYDVIIIPGLEEKIEARFRYHPKNNGVTLPHYTVH